MKGSHEADHLAMLGLELESANGLDSPLPTIKVLMDVIENTVQENHRMEPSLYAPATQHVVHPPTCGELNPKIVSSLHNMKCYQNL